MKFQDLSDKTIAIWGMGKEGQAIYATLQKKVPSAKLLIISEENTPDILKADILIKSPGVSIYRDEVQHAIQQGVYCTSGTNLFLKNKPLETKVIAVTGTKGKSTTSSLLYHTLCQFGKRVALAGNIGKPLIECVDDHLDFIIAELSSYQTSDLRGDIEMAILTNLYPEHLQWHQTHERYYLDKINLLNQTKCVIVNEKQERSRSKTKHLTQKVGFNTQTSIHHKEGTFFDGDTPLFKSEGILLKGEHNLENACAVLTVLKQLNLPLEKAQNAFNSFNPLPHRLEVLGQSEGITYVDDSISTTPETAIAAVNAFLSYPFITLIVGGMDRGQDYTELVSFLTKIQAKICLITLPDTGERAYQLAKENALFCLKATSMAEAVNLAKTYTTKGGIVLLSPAAPSYNLYKNFEERGHDFKKNIFS